MSELSSPTSIGIYFIIELIAVVVGSLAVVYLVKIWDKVKIIIQSVRKDDKVGFGIRVERKTVKHAQVRCNDVDYKWEDQNGDLSPETTLWAGDNRLKMFFPYNSGIKYVEDISKYGDIKALGMETTKGGLLIFVKDAKTEKILYQFPQLILKGIPAFTSRSLVAEPNIETSIKIIGEGIEEKRDYDVVIRVKNINVPSILEEKPVIDKVNYDFDIKLKKKHFGLW